MIDIDYCRNELFTDFGLATLKDRYLLPGEDPQEALARAAKAFSDSEDMAQRIYDYASKHWLSFSTPILSNGGTEKGLGISCFLQAEIQDDRQSILDHYDETAWLSTIGGGTSGSWSQLRANGSRIKGGGVSTGIIPFMHVVDSEMLAFSQRGTRRGSYAAYLDVSHPEIEEFITMRKPTGGDGNRKNLNLHHGVNISDGFMLKVKAGMDWPLIDPSTKQIVKTLKARDLWQLLLETRLQTGEPYLHFIDRSNESLPESQKALGLKINQSNLCSEITLPTNDERTAVCCLSSLNLAYWDDWKTNEEFIPDVVRFLDNVIDHFIKNAPNQLAKAVYSASRERSIGIGTLGWHTLLQKKMLPFEGPLAFGLNNQIFESISEQAHAASIKLSREKGPCPDSLSKLFSGKTRAIAIGGINTDPSVLVVREAGIRNMHLTAIAPNASSSIIFGGVSPSVEPIVANAYTHKTLSGSFLVKNKQLQELLQKKGIDNESTWKSIITGNGSVQHLDQLDDWEKQVFRTAFELNQLKIISLAAARQIHIDQAQSINLFFDPKVDVTYLHKVHWDAWQGGLKTLYYLRSRSIANMEKVSDAVERKIRLEDDQECLNCQ